MPKHMGRTHEKVPSVVHGYTAHGGLSPKQVAAIKAKGQWKSSYKESGASKKLSGGAGGKADAPAKGEKAPTRKAAGGGGAKSAPKDVKGGVTDVQRKRSKQMAKGKKTKSVGKKEKTPAPKKKESVTKQKARKAAGQRVKTLESKLSKLQTAIKKGPWEYTGQPGKYDAMVKEKGRLKGKIAKYGVDVSRWR